MDKELRKKWVEALRSGVYEQTTYNYIVRDFYGQESFSAIAILMNEHNPNFSYDGCFLGYSDEDGNYKGLFFEPNFDFEKEVMKLGLTKEHLYEINYKNDNGFSFAEIAQYIEENL